MRKFGIKILKRLDIRRDLTLWYNHHLSDKFIKEEMFYGCFKENYPLRYSSRKFDKSAIKYKSGACICSDGRVGYWEGGKRVK